MRSLRSLDPESLRLLACHIDLSSTPLDPPSILTYSLPSPHSMGVERPEDLESLILAQTQALSLCPTGHPDRPISLARLAYTLKRRYEQRGDVQDLESMLSMEREAKLLCPADHPKRSMFLLNLAYSLGKKYERFGDMESMDEMISLEREALHLCPSDHQNRSISLNNLAYSLKKRFERSGAIEDLEGMMSMEREALHPLSSRSSQSRDVPLKSRLLLKDSIRFIEGYRGPGRSYIDGKGGPASPPSRSCQSP